MKGMNASAQPISDKAAGALCYLATPLSALVFLLAPPYSGRPFVRFHALQAIFYFAAGFAAVLVLRVLSAILLFVPLLGKLIIALLAAGLWCGFLGVWLLLMWRALQGERWRLPVLGDFAERQAR